MLNSRLAVVVTGLSVAGWLWVGSPGRSQQDQDQPAAAANQAADQAPEGMEVLARGPIHEAYAEPVDYRPQPSKVVPKQPPPNIEEVPPDQKPAGENVQWIPGYWAWDDDRNDFIWVSGIWRIAPPDRQWFPGHWSQVEGGWQWTPGYWSVVGQDQVAYLPQPPDPLESGPSTPAPDDTSVFVPGSWVYQETRYAWRPGYWVDYRPGWVWIPAHYVWTPAGYVFVEGYWDFELDRRGLLFAPVYFRTALWDQPNWYYRPHFCVYDRFLFGALFLRPGYGHYYFGDYFEPVYARRGFVAWVDFRFGRFGYDPLYNYYRWAHRDDRRWVQDLRGHYSDRYNGVVARPPRTLVQQNTLIQNITNNNITNIRNVNNVTVVAHLSQVDRRVVNLRPVTRQEITQEQTAARRLVEVSQQRRQLEHQLVTKGTAPSQTKAAPQVVKFDLPKPAVTTRPSTRNTPPPPPVRPRNLVNQSPTTEPRPSVRPTPEPRPRVEPTPRTEVQPRPEPRPRTEVPSRTEPAPRVAPRPEPRPEPRPRVEPRPAPRPEPRPEPRPRVEPRPDPRPEPRPQPRPPERPEVRPPVTPSPEPRPAPRPEPRVEPRPQPRPEPRVEPRPQPRPEPRVEPRPQPPSQPRPEPRKPDRPEKQ